MVEPCNYKLHKPFQLERTASLAETNQYPAAQVQRKEPRKRTPEAPAQLMAVKEAAKASVVA